MASFVLYCHCVKLLSIFLLCMLSARTCAHGSMVATGGKLDCEHFSGRFLSPWQVSKKALWDYLRGMRFEASLQQPALAHMAWSLEKAVEENDFEFSPMGTCPAGMIALRLYLLELSSNDSNAEFLKKWLDALLRDTLRLSWSSLLSSQWPIFAFFHRVVSRNGWPSLYASNPLTSKLSTFAEHETHTAPSLLPSLMQEIAASSITMEEHSPDDLGAFFLAPEAQSFWASLEWITERHMFATAIGGPSPSYAAAHYFLSHMSSEFVGTVEALHPFLRAVLVKSAHTLRRRFSCWDIGAAPEENSLEQNEEVWEICFARGGLIQAFEPSAIGYARLVSALRVIGAEGAARRVALSNFTGSSVLRRGGQSIGSLGERACGLWITFEECEGFENWESVNVTSVDTLLGSGTLDILKVDTEGQEWEIVLGAQKAVAEGRIGMVILEYGEKWSRELAMAAKHYDGAYHYREAAYVPEPSLWSVVRWFLARGYEAFLIGSETSLPISGLMWHDIYEVCRAPHRAHYHGVGVVCWFDVAFVHERHPFAAASQSVIDWDAIDEHVRALSQDNAKRQQGGHQVDRARLRAYSSVTD